MCPGRAVLFPSPGRGAVSPSGGPYTHTLRGQRAGRERAMLPQHARGAWGWNPLLCLAGAMHPRGVNHSCIYLRLLPCPKLVPSPAESDLIAGRNRVGWLAACKQQGREDHKAWLPRHQGASLGASTQAFTSLGQAAAILVTNHRSVFLWWEAPPECKMSLRLS